MIDAIGTASCSIADLVAMSRMKNYHSRVGDLNFSGDNQTHLDVLSNKIFVDALRATGQVEHITIFSMTHGVIGTCRCPRCSLKKKIALLKAHLAATW